MAKSRAGSGRRDPRRPLGPGYLPKGGVPAALFHNAALPEPEPLAGAVVSRDAAEPARGHRAPASVVPSRPASVLHNMAFAIAAAVLLVALMLGVLLLAVH